MTTWRMAFKVGTGGDSLWDECRVLGVAAITYAPLARTDLSKYSKGEPADAWGQLQSGQHASLRAVAYEMKAGDVIYVKDGPWIRGRGVVKGAYQFDASFRIVDKNKYPWPHQVPVEWDPEFTPVLARLGRNQRSAVARVSSDDSDHLEALAASQRRLSDKVAAEEGQTVLAEILFRSRNRALIDLKKSRSDYSCEACGFNFEKSYGSIGQHYIVAHHLNPISQGTRTTTLEDIALLCANCHVMAHTETPPLSVAEVRRQFARRPGIAT